MSLSYIDIFFLLKFVFRQKAIQLTGHDFVILVLETAVAMDGKKVEIAKLPVEHAASTDGKDLIVSGWGRT